MYVSTTVFFIQGSYIGYMFRLIDQSSSGLFSRLSHKVLCTNWDPSVCTPIKYIKSDQLLSETLTFKINVCTAPLDFGS